MAGQDIPSHQGFVLPVQIHLLKEQNSSVSAEPNRPRLPRATCDNREMFQISAIGWINLLLRMFDASDPLTQRFLWVNNYSLQLVVQAARGMLTALPWDPQPRKPCSQHLHCKIKPIFSASAKSWVFHQLYTPLGSTFLSLIHTPVSSQSKSLQNYFLHCLSK